MILYPFFEWLDLKGWLIFLLVLLLLIDVIRNKNPPNYPPGPWPLPVLGNIFTGVDFKTMDKLAEEYGDVFSLRWGSDKAVFVSGYKMVKEALITQLDSFADRPAIPLFHEVFKGLGVALSNGYLWKMQRKFANSHLRYFGEGKKSIELSIQQEGVFLCEAFKEEKGPFDPRFILNNAVSNIICSLIFGRRFDYNDDHFQRILRLDAEAIELAGSAQAQLYNAFPGLFRYLPGPHRKIFANYRIITDFLREEIRTHKEEWDPSDPRDYIDAYLTEMDKKESDPEAGFNIESLVVATLDMFEAGTETSATTIRWGLLFLMRYPDIQKKVQDEIDKVIGQSRQPTLADRPNMPYTDAVIHETQRVGNIVPLGFPKMASKDTTLGGYFIPKGTLLNTNLSSVLKDKNEWETPNDFNPGHFLDDQGKFRRRDAFLPFSAGKRVCLGEQLARMELFLFFTSILQRFTIVPGPNEELSLEGQLGFTYSPSPYKICVVSRSMFFKSLFDCLDIQSCLLFLFVFLLISDIVKNKYPPNYPPGPWPLPLLGNVFISADHKTVDKLTEQYGNVLSLRKGSERMVFVSGFKMVKEVLVTQGETFSDRPVSPLFHETYKGRGLSFSNGHAWKKQQQFAIGHLKNFGEGKKTLEHHIQQECRFLRESFREEQGCPFDPLHKINNAVANVIGTLVFGHRHEYDDIQFQKLLQMSAESVYLTGSIWHQMFDAFPGIMKLLPGPHHTIISNYRRLAAFLKEKVEKHRLDWNPDEPRDFIDSYLTEIEKNDQEAQFDEDNLVWCIVDLFEGGTETTTNTLRWMLLYMIKYPDVQEKVQAEIDREIGWSRQPTMADRPNMPYTNAVIHEVHRIGNLAPLNMPRMARKDTTLGGYFLPKGTVVITNLTSVLFDKNEWETPHIFNPGHFLDSEGQFRRREAFYPFSAGKRQCPGEYLARVELFLLFTTLLQTFTFSPPPGVEPSLESQVGFTQTPLPYKFCASPRRIPT
ncbi:cytochrome P450 2J3 [Chanos chanos]|uniref:Cytochrome P450 2J3 n=1 Tax=Chanos chanos TaxID=29144 RepID=A0A6J2V6Q1_CHACN|nr:cytochrome P450 2J3-like [Chanos chanos]